MKGLLHCGIALLACLQFGRAGEVDDYINYQFLDQTKAELASGNNKAAATLKTWADREVKSQGFYTVTNKTDFGNGITKNHFVSFPRYYWPTCEKSMAEAVKSCSFEGRDGKPNRELIGLSNNPNQVNGICKDVTRLAVAAYLYDDKTYAARGFYLLDKFFVDETTRMLPNLDYGQMEPGKGGGKGRPYGLIQTRCFVSLVSAVPLLRQVSTDHESVHDGVVDWFRKFTEWFTTSEIGKSEIAGGNNHGTSATIQLASYYRFLLQEDKAIAVVDSFLKGAFQDQIDSEGGQPRELKRVDSFDYATMNLGFLLVMGQLSKDLKHNIWDAATKAGTTIQDAVDYFLPYASGQSWKGGKGADLSQATHYFQLAAAQFGDNDGKYLKAIKAIGKTSRDETSYHRLYSDYSYGLTSDTLHTTKV
ncbi:hypothetical protein H4R35_004783 [Dimargaris xerosporica]|nr:hypothetical protein H4R35_004783 [Dimargaris xerosporica]